MNAALQAKLVHQVVLEPRTGVNVENAPAFGPPVQEAAWVSSARKMIRTKEGAEVLSTAQIVLAPDTTATPDSRFTLADGSTPKVLTVDDVNDPVSGDPDHVTVYLA